MTLDPGVVGAYTEAGPVFAQGTFVRQFLGSAEGLRKNIVGSASAKFVTRTAGTYQIGFRTESPSGNLTCYGTLSLNGAVVVEDSTNGTSVRTKPVELPIGCHDANFVFGCGGYYTEGIIRRSAPAIAGKATIVVVHPNESAFTSSVRGDFVRSVK